MRTTQAVRYARWSAAMALLVATVVSAVYARRAWQAHLAHLSMHPSVPASVQQQTAAFSLSKVTGDRTEYTVRASHATEFAEGGRSVLQDVWVTAYGQDGQRFDNLHTRSCDYMQQAGDIVCAGEVQIDLQSAEDAKLHPTTSERPDPASQIIHVETRGVTFNRKMGVATTDQPVTFYLPQGEGRAIGFRYETAKGSLTLTQKVEMTLRESQTSANLGSNVPLAVSSSSLTYDRDRHVIRLLGSVEAHRGTPRLTAGILDIDLDSSMKARRMVASQHPVLHDAAHGEPVSISADQFTGVIAPNGMVESITGVGSVHALAQGTAGENRLQSDRADLELVGRLNKPKRLTAAGNVVAVATRPDGSHQNLSTSTLDIAFADDGGKGQARIAQATTPAAVLDWDGWTAAGGRPVAQVVRMTAQHWDARFGPANQVEELHGNGDAHFERRIGNGAAETSTSRDLLARFGLTGEWSSVEQTGGVTLQQPNRNARATTLHYDRLASTAELSGAVELSDPDSVTSAQSATLRQASNEFHAEGRVVTLQGAASATDFTQGPARISADRLDANTATGHAVYSGNAQLWQGDSVIEAQSIDLDRATHIATADGRVRAIFPQTQAAAVNAKPTGSKQDLWHAEAERMTYASDEGRGRLERNVFAHSAQGSMHSDVMDLFFTPADSVAGNPAAATVASKSVANAAPNGGRRLASAVGSGNVQVSQQDRQGTSSRADYSSSDGKFVLSGGPPVVRDASGNSVTGRQLTLFYADDTIVVDSAEGLRTLTLHRVGK